jgi:hypothetical protein
MKLLFLAISLVPFAFADSVSLYCGEAFTCDAGILSGAFPGGIIILEGSNASASIIIQDDFQILITGGVGNGTYRPCFNVGSNGFGSASLSADVVGTSQFWNVSEFTITGSKSEETCPEVTPFTFTFDVPFDIELTEQLSAMAAGFPLDGNGEANVDYEGAAMIMDSSGDIIPTSGNVSITEFAVPTPEPASISLVLAGIVLCRVRARKRRPGSRVLYFNFSAIPISPSGRSSGNRITSRMDLESVSSMTRRSMPMPSPAVGGMP